MENEKEVGHRATPRDRNESDVAIGESDESPMNKSSSIPTSDIHAQLNVVIISADGSETSPVGDCCPSGSLPALSCSYTPRGSEEKLGDLPLYVAGEKSEFALIVSYDIYGFHGGRIRNICDQLADQGYYVVLPDFFRGECWTAERNETEPDAKMPWIKAMSNPESVRNDLVSVIGLLKSRGVRRQGKVPTTNTLMHIYSLSSSNS